MAIILQPISLLAVLAALVLPCTPAEPSELVSGSGDLHLPDPDEPNPTMTEEQVNSALAPGYPGLFEGDMILTEDQRAAIEKLTRPSDPFEPQRAITRRENRRWLGGRVPYLISRDLGSKARSAIEAAVREYSSHTCIQLYPRGSERDYIYFYKGSGCSSNVGRVGGGQRISIGSGCEYKGIVIHEIFHALGRWHEQSRPDRDDYITVKYENMKNGVEPNFIKLSTEQVKTQGVDYDYQSIMHYSAYAFSRNGRPTIEPKDRSVSSRSLGQRSGLSSRDIQHARALYCTAEPASWGGWGSWSSCSRTCNGGTRSRYRSCVGGSSCIGSRSQSETCNSQACLSSAKWSSWGSWSRCSASCGGGRQGRTRRCLNGNTCSGASTVYRSCNSQVCPAAAGTWSAWSSWAPCSASCGGGVQTSSRQCLREPCEGLPSRQKTCSTHQCPTESSDVRHQGCYRVLPGYGLFLLERRTDLLKDNPFQRAEAVEKCAQAASQLSYSIIGVAAGYCISGNNRLSDFTKVASNVCRGGRGAYRSGVFHMDVYTVTNTATLSDGPQLQSDDVESQGQATTSSSNHFRTSFLTFFFITMTLTVLQIL